MNIKELRNKYPGKEFGEINVSRENDYPKTGNKDKWGNEEKDYSDTAQVIDKGWKFYLNHSCDEWIIGDIEKANDFHESLSQAVEYAENNPL